MSQLENNVTKSGYYLGLDMGTDSVGWAVTDDKYNILRAKGKDLWGMREFEEAQTAADRRSHRTSRRRYQREVVRIGLLKDYFHDAIAKVDPLFYQRLENSAYFLEDKDECVRNKNGIFNDKNYTDRDYYRKYPTIFHLRMELINNPEPHDVRLIYLALLQMFKHRGHFLNASLGNEGNEKEFSDLLREMGNTLADITGTSLADNVVAKDVELVLSKRELSRTGKSERLAELFSITKKDKVQFECIKGICGLSIDARKIFEPLENEDKKIEICFSSSGYDEKITDIQGAVGDENYALIEIMKSVYDAGMLAGIMKGKHYLSEARIEDFEKHKKDLSVLKKVIKKYKTDEYDSLFRSEANGSYSAYVDSFNSGVKQRRDMKERKKEDFYKTVKTLIKDMPSDDKDIKYINNEIECDNFMPKQMTSSNGVIPNQVHLFEMKKILGNAESYLPFLKEKDESGYSVAERIIKLFAFQIPYYVGPVSEDSGRNGGNGWVVRKEKGKVLPWNIDEKIDMRKTSEQFISRLVRKCTYISGENVLPKESLEYQKYALLNEINVISVDGERISTELKQKMYKELFMSGKSVTRKKIVSYLHNEGILSDETQLSGIDEKVNSNLSSYSKFKSVFGDKIDQDRYREIAEQIIFWCTVYGDDKKYLSEQLEEKYKDELTDDQIKRITGFKFKDWGKMSKAFLELPGCDKEDGEVVPLVRMMWNTNHNMMELINSEEYTYKDELFAKQRRAINCISELKLEDLDEMYFSAPVKRMVWQTLQIITELEKVMGTAPTKVFVEMTRKHDDNKKRTQTRKDKFLDLYRSVKNDEHNWSQIINTADSDGTIRSKKMYLYLTQKGRCMYTGRPIDLDRLFDDNLYDIDHIYPRHYVKDDNIDNNMVLVEKEKNAHKSDIYPVESSIFSNCVNMWKELYNGKFISEEKFKRLTGREPFNDEQKAGFIARQLVETSQGTKGVSDIIKEALPDETRIIYSKASNVSEFRQEFTIPKSRLINDFHHAHDAYLNIVVGNVYETKFTQNPMNFIKTDYRKDQERNKYNLSRMFDWNVSRGLYTAWTASINSKKNRIDHNIENESGTICTVRKMLKKTTPILTRLSYVGQGGLANATVYSAKKASAGKGYLPLKTEGRLSDVSKYGGVTNASVAYFFLVEYEEKGKKIRSLETVPVYMAGKVGKDKVKLEEYCRDILHLSNPSVRVPQIKLASLVKVDGYLLHITGKTGNQICLRNAVNLCEDVETVRYLKKLENSENKGYLEEEITEDENIKLYQNFMDKHINSIFRLRPNPVGDKLLEGFDRFKSLSVEEQTKVLLQMLNLTGIVAGCAADLTAIGESKATGKMLIPQKIIKFKEIKLINQSVTGLYDKSIDLLTV